MSEIEIETRNQFLKTLGYGLMHAILKYEKE